MKGEESGARAVNIDPLMAARELLSPENEELV